MVPRETARDRRGKRKPPRRLRSVQALQQRQVQTEIRLATELVAVVSAVREVRDAILGERKLDTTLADHEERIRVLEPRAG